MGKRPPDTLAFLQWPRRSPLGIPPPPTAPTTRLWCEETRSVLFLFAHSLLRALFASHQMAAPGSFVRHHSESSFHRAGALQSPGPFPGAPPQRGPVRLAGGALPDIHDGYDAFGFARNVGPQGDPWNLPDCVGCSSWSLVPPNVHSLFGQPGCCQRKRARGCPLSVEQGLHLGCRFFPTEQIIDPRGHRHPFPVISIPQFLVFGLWPQEEC